MSSEKNQNEFSKLLKDKDKDSPEIIYQEIFRKPQRNKLYLYIIKLLNNNFVLLLLLVIMIFLVLLYRLLVSIKEQNNFSFDYEGDYEEFNEKKYKPLNITNLYNETKMCTENKKFIILSRTNCQACGLFSYYIVHLGCIITYLNEGYIPIIEVSSFSNIFIGTNDSTTTSNYNPWEDFFNQPCGYTLNDVKIKFNKKDIEYDECRCTANMPSEKEIYGNKTALKFYRDMAKKYMSVKKEIIEESNVIWEKLFNNSKKVLGVLVRGTDYVAIMPTGHSIPPTPEAAIYDAKSMDKKNKYDYIFLATEDINIRKKFIEEFNDKLKYLSTEEEVEYDYDERNYLSFHDDVYGNMKFHKTYLMSMIVISKCLDIISARTSGACGAFILSEGFRTNLVYYLGEY